MGRKLVKKGSFVVKIRIENTVRRDNKTRSCCSSQNGNQLPCYKGQAAAKLYVPEREISSQWKLRMLWKFMDEVLHTSVDLCLVDPSHNPCFFKGNRNWAWSKKACSQRSFEGNRKVNRISHTFNNLLSFVLRFGSGTFWSDMCNSFQY